MTLALPAFLHSYACNIASRRQLGKLTGFLALLFTGICSASAQTATTTTLALSTSTTATGVSFTTLTATVTTGSGAPSRGRVAFCDTAAGTATACVASKHLSTVQLIQSGGNAGKAIYRISPRLGTHNFYAIYLPSTLYATSTSAIQVSTVSGTGTTATTIAQSGSTGNYSLTATVAGTLGTAPAGTVDFLDETASFNQLGSATLVPGASTSLLTSTSNPGVSGQPSAALSFDFNNDGILDLAVADEAINGLSLLKGTGAAQFVVVSNADLSLSPFTPSPYYATTGTNPSAMVSADFNGDGNPDILIANGNGSYSVLLGNGSGLFTTTTTSISSLLSNSPSQLAVGDFNGDGYTDIAIPGGSKNSVVILLGHGDGTFTASSITGLSTPLAVAAGDFNRDGKQDLVAGEESDVVILLGNGDGTFAKGQTISQGGASSIVVGDFNGDGFVDIATAISINFALGNSDIISMLGAGDGTFTQVQDLAPNALESDYLVGGDFNGDGLTDVALMGRGKAVNNTHVGYVTGIAIALGDGTFGAPILSAANATTSLTPSAFTSASFTDNGVPYVAATFLSSGDGTPSGTYYDTSAVYLASTQSTSTATATNINPVGTGTHNVGAFYLGQSPNDGSNSSTTALTASGLLTNTISFPQPTSPVAVGGTATLAATSTSGAILYTITAGTATISGSTITYTTAGTVQITASSPASGNYAAATPVSVTVNVTQPTASVTWLPSTLSIYTGTPLGAGILDATDSVPATIGYSAYLLTSGSASAATVSNGTLLSQGAYGLVANITPTSTSYAAQAVTLPFNVQNMNVFVAAQISMASFFNNGNTQSSATAGGGLGASVDSSGSVWSIDSTGTSVSKFSNAGALLASYTLSNGATALAVDGLGHVWITNSNGTVSELNNDGTSNLSAVASAGNLSNPASVSIDTAGSLWISNPGNNTVTETFGQAAPAAPVSAAVYNNNPGTRP